MNKRFYLLAVTLLAVAVLFAGCGQSDEPAADESSEATEPAAEATEENGADEAVETSGDVVQLTVSAHNFGFDQERYEVPLGATVEITFENEEGYHEAIIAGYDVELTAKEPVTFVADQPGEFDLSCSVVCGPMDEHNNMRATFVVTE
ncbi:cytochrome c oxidase subunit 2 [Caldalkalibacillus uzonensis]|uniref:Cytochrome c oxidase subunit 2 n=1 Tax=Caldalkalibacillus uzonensis TaxID=353224 RepID=A0ABU0CUV7_9BACI|nr:hypothetical protein [Caldalkalibacillus uzonensis]MDQ0339888.1 cytochrome c oxidase subunit 2 [Caldalkalibacillus uzonensis]